MAIYAFTSIAANYVPKARVLASSLKAHDPDVRFCLLLAEPVPEDPAIEGDEFDEIVTIDELGIEDSKAWIFKHTVVEICTAVKGLMLKRLLARADCEAAFYFDPDMAIFSGLDGLTARFEGASILLTPHVTVPEQSLEAIRDNEMAALKHGVYNLGFIGVKNTPEGRRFADWWCHRLTHFCYDDIPNGLFTDQRWVDLAPAFFDEIEVVRDPGWNVATWNLTHRTVAGSLDAGLTVNGRPLRFYHFSGFDSGAQYAMLKKYGGDNPALFALRGWYIKQCDAYGAERFGRLRWRFDRFDNGESVSRAHRRLYRLREDLQQTFPDPFDTADVNRSYYDWYRINHAGRDRDPREGDQAELLAMYKAELESIHASRAWRWVAALRRLRKALRFGPAGVNPYRSVASER